MRVLRRPAESVNLMASGEVVIQSMWSPAVAAVRSALTGLTGQLAAACGDDPDLPGRIARLTAEAARWPVELALAREFDAGYYGELVQFGRILPWASGVTA